MSGARRVSYGELNRRANAVAWRLREEHGIGPDTPVGLLLERGLDLAVSVLGVLKAGGAYVPLDPRYPDERISLLVSDARLDLVVTCAEFESRIAGLTPVARVEDLTAPGTPTANPPCVAAPEHLANIIYTSGSTGAPKGIEVPHRSLLGFMTRVDYMAPGPDDRFLQHSSMSWDAFALEFWTPLTHGGCCVLHQGPSTIDSIREVVRSEAVTTLFLTSTLFNMFVNEGLADLRGVRTLLVGGEAMSPTHAARAIRELPETLLVNGYGPCECTVFTCVQPMDAGIASEGGGSYRTSIRRPDGVRGRPWPESCSDRHGGRVVRRRAQLGAGLPRTASPVRRALRSQSLRFDERRATLSHRGPRAVYGVRCLGVHPTPRRASQGSRVPRRTRGD